jgi:hypothetical protein
MVNRLHRCKAGQNGPLWPEKAQYGKSGCPRNRVVFGTGEPARHCQWGGYRDADQPDLVPTWTPPHRPAETDSRTD